MRDTDRSAACEPSRCAQPQNRTCLAEAGKSEIVDEWVVADAVAIELVSTTEFPAIREKNREFIDSGMIFGPERSKNPLKPGLRSHIPYALEQGILGAEQGILGGDQGFSSKTNSQDVVMGALLAGCWQERGKTCIVRDEPGAPFNAFRNH